MENSFPGPMTMVKIDGAKIKRLREQQGLTQLYLATAVEVTTDTISRWENKRYPSIKRENGLKLAEALGIPLDELLDTDLDEETEPKQQPTDSSPEKETPKEIPRVHPVKKIWPILLLSFTLLLIIAAFSFFFLQSQVAKHVEAVRITPLHAIRDQPIPVVLRLTETSGEPTALILNESLPHQCSTRSVTPAPATKDSSSTGLKWLGKVNGSAVYSYILTCKLSDQRIQLHGTTSISGKNELSIGGNSHVELGTHHWADENKDNIISDEEILIVYDRYSDVVGLEQEIDMIEEIWLGSGYKWDNQDEAYQILE